MEVSQIEFIIAWVSILVTILGAVLGTFAFLHREMRDGFKSQDSEIKELRTDVTDLKVGVARIEGHLGIGFPAGDERRATGEPRAVASPGSRLTLE